MRFNLSAATFVALATSVFAQTADFDPITKPAAQEVIPAGSTYTIVWDAPAKYAAGTVKISLIGGETQGTQVPLLDIAAGVKNSAKAFSWAVPATLGDKKVYGLVLTLEGTEVFQYSNPFHIKASTYGGGSGTTTVTTAHGIKTVSLSTTSTPVATTSSPVPVITTTSAVYVHTTSAIANTTATFITKTAPPTVIVVPSSAPNATAPPPAVVTSPPTGAAGHVAAAPLAFIGGLAVALLAL